MQFETPTGLLTATPDTLIVAGWTGRDGVAVAHHIEELQALGVAPPSQTPLYYRVSSSLLTQSARIEVLGEATSGEAEPLILQAEASRWIGLASDHTDRALEAHSVAHSKQVCAKPAASALWPLADVEPHLDALEIRSWICENDTWELYQSGTLAMLRPLPELMAGAGIREGTALLCGTFAAIGGVRPSTAMRMEMSDPVLNRRITLEYQTISLPLVS